MDVEIGGRVEPGFERVRDAFAHNFVELGEAGASYAFYVDGAKVAPNMRQSCGDIPSP